MTDFFYKRPSDLGKLVTVGGPGGTGSSTVAKILAKKWGLHRIDAGEIMRNKTPNGDLNEYLEDHIRNHDTVDRAIDQYLVRMSYYPNMLIEGKFFAAISTLVGIPCTVRIWVTANLDTRVHRLLHRDGMIKAGQKIDRSHSNYKRVEKDIMQRQTNDIKRCRALYHVDLMQPERFNDIVIDTTGLNIPITIKTVLKMIKDNPRLRKKFQSNELTY